MRTACFTVDLDRDVNFHSIGMSKACSIDRGFGTEPRFSSSAKGASILAELFKEIGIKGTFFAEATTIQNTNVFDSICENEISMHGLDHEDLSSDLFAGPSGTERIIKILNGSYGIIKDITGKKPMGFRAPYMKPDGRMYEILEDIGIKYDSSKYEEMKEKMFPYKIGKITEIPIPTSVDGKGKKIAAYLWPMHEGKRSVKDYIEMADKMIEGVFVVATHTWHMVESRENGMMNEKEISKNTSNVKKIIETLLEKDFKFKTMDSFITP